MEGWVLRRRLENNQKTYDLRLTDEGKKLLDLVDSRLFHALTHRGEAPADLSLTYRFEELWSKSTS
jgi:DNA-binding MarR family transcriptional regulator